MNAVQRNKGDFKNHVEHKNTSCGQIAEIFTVKPDGIYTNHKALKGNQHYS
jgi:hypothetical protein